MGTFFPHLGLPFQKCYVFTIQMTMGALALTGLGRFGGGLGRGARDILGSGRRNLGVRSGRGRSPFGGGEGGGGCPLEGGGRSVA